MTISDMGDKFSPVGHSVLSAAGKGEDKFDNGNEHEHILHIIGSLFRHFFSTKMF